MPAGKVLKIQGREVRVNNLEKILVPSDRFRKVQILDYYIRVSPYILPHLKDRPLTLKLFIDGFGAPVRYLKNAPSYTPEWVPTAAVPRQSGAGHICFVLANDLPTLAWTAALSNIEMHTLLARVPKIHVPTTVMFDLDPGAPATALDSARVALELKDLLDAAGLKAFVKSSGSKGLHVVVPLNSPVTYQQTQKFAQVLAAELTAAHPDSVTDTMSKRERVGKVFVDYSQNSFHKSTACVYCLRATANGTRVSMPVDWADLAKHLKRGDAEAFFPKPEQALAQLEECGDTFAPVLRLKQDLPRVSKQAGAGKAKEPLTRYLRRLAGPKK